MVFAQTKLLSRYGLHFPKGSLNGITPPHLFWNRDRVDPPKLQLNYFFKHLLYWVRSVLSFSLTARKDMEPLFPHILKLQYGGGKYLL